MRLRREIEMKRLAIVLEKIFAIFFMLFSAGVAVSAFYEVSNYEKNQVWKISCVVVILFFVYIACCTANLLNKCTKKEGYKNAVSIFALSLCVHLLVVWAVGQYTEQVSDFASAFALSQENFPLTEAPDYYRVFSNWALYPLYLKLIQELFGSGALIGIIFNAVLCAFSSTFIYVLFHLGGGVEGDRVGYLAALIYTFWPSHLLYSVILTPEFLNIFLTLLFCCCIQMAVNHHNEKIIYILTGLSAVVLALSGFFKSIDKIVLIVLGIMLILYLLKGNDIQLRNCEKSILCKTVLIVAIFAGSYIISNQLIFLGLDYAYGEVVNRNPTAHFVYIGLNPETYGTWNENAWNVYKDNVVKCNYDYDMASDLTYQQLKVEIEQKRHLKPTYFKKKFMVAWGNTAETYWAIETIKEEAPFFKKPDCFYIVGILAQNFWIAICSLVCIEAVFLLFCSDRMHFFICLVLFGFACLMFLTEVQERYKCVMYPFLSILAADGVVRTNDVLKTICHKIKYYLWLSTKSDGK